MLTKRQNLIECITGGNPDRYVNQWEALAPILANPFDLGELDENGQCVDDWGVRFQVAGQPGRMPMHDEQNTVIKDIADWKDYLKQCPIGKWDNPAVWEPMQKQAAQVNRDEQFVMACVIPGVFERTHHLCGFTEVLMALYEEPEAMHGLIDLIVENELQQAEAICKYLKPDALLHHDDWGTQVSTIMSTDMFEEFLFEPYKKIYGYYKDHGVELIVHHSDSFGVSLVPYMIDLGIDIWQGCLLRPNELPKLIKQYGGQISFMGGLDADWIDTPDWTPEGIRSKVNEALDYVDSKNYFIPCLTQGLCISINEGVFDEISTAIDEHSKADF